MTGHTPWKDIKHKKDQPLEPEVTEQVIQSLRVQRDKAIKQRDLLFDTLTRITDITASDDKPDSIMIQIDNLAYPVIALIDPTWEPS